MNNTFIRVRLWGFMYVIGRLGLISEDVQVIVYYEIIKVYK
jgi:hypothetical protein